MKTRVKNWFAGATDALAGALGAWLTTWLRLFLYAMLGMLAGLMLGDAARIGGVVVGVSLIAELVIAIAAWLFDWRRVLVRLYVLVWWPLRKYWGTESPFGNGRIPTESRQAALDFLLAEVAGR